MAEPDTAVTIRPIRPDEWRRWRETRLRMLRDDADFFSTRYDDMVREPDAMWREWVAEAAAGDDKTLFIAEDGDAWLGVVGAFVRINSLEVQLISMWVAPEARGRGVARDLDSRRRCLDARPRLGACRSLRAGGEHPGPAALRAGGLQPTGDRAPASAGRSAFKLVLAAPVADLLT